MEILSKSKYNLILDRLKEISFNTLFAKTVLKDTIDGKVFVDDNRYPSSYLISHPCGMSLLFGNINNSDFNTELLNYILNKENFRNKTEWLQAYPDDWNRILSKLLDSFLINYNSISNKLDIREINEYIKKNKINHIIQWNRVNFFYSNNKLIQSKQNKRKEYDLTIINTDNISLAHESIVSENFWKSDADFLKNGIGFILLNKREFVSVAYSAFRDNNKLEIGVETAETYRNKGLAKIVSEVLLNYCIDNNLEPLWACEKENIGSYRLALSLGFKEKYTIPFYELICQY